LTTCWCGRLQELGWFACGTSLYGFMVEIFAGSAVLCSVAKQQGMYIRWLLTKFENVQQEVPFFNLTDLTLQADRSLLEDSPGSW